MPVKIKIKLNGRATTLADREVVCGIHARIALGPERYAYALYRHADKRPWHEDLRLDDVTPLRAGDDIYSVPPVSGLPIIFVDSDY